uniref:Uncharacterized protein n=1 Tax=Rhizophagus irregularis (strain DAOM 181602 / DAOM 197198 / MUCL 43194) TaxID=747089 RepID=U9U7M0_RHIID
MTVMHKPVWCMHESIYSNERIHSEYMLSCMRHEVISSDYAGLVNFASLAVTVRIEQITCSQSLKWTKLKFVNKCTYVSKGSIENLNIPDEWLYHSKLKFRVYEPLLIENTLDDIRSKFQKSQKFQKFQKLVGEHHLHGKAIGCGSIRLNFLEPDQKIERVIDLKAKGSQEIIGRIKISMHTSRTQLQPHSNVRDVQLLLEDFDGGIMEICKLLRSRSCDTQKRL